MLQTNIREGYRITTLEVIKLIEDLTSYLAVAKYTQLQNAQIPKVFHKAAYSAKVKTEDLSNTLTLTLSKTAQQQSSSVVSNRSTALITNKFSVTLLTKPAILNNANVALVDAMHHSVVKQFSMFRLITKESQQKLEENYFKVIDALTITLIKNNDDLLGTVNSHIKLRRLRAPSPPEQPSLPKKRGRHSKLILDRPPLKRRKTEAADSRHAKASRRRTKKDKDSEDSDTSSDVLRSRRRDRAAACARLAKRKQLGKKAQLKKTRDEEELAKAKKEKEEKEAQERKTQPDSLLDSNNYRLDSSSDINPKDNSENEEATIAKDLAREQKERLKALLNAKTRDSLSTRVETAIEHYTLEDCNFTLYQLTDAYILYFKELLSNNSRIFANAIGIGKTQAIVLATEVQNARAESNATEHNAVNDDDKLCLTKGKRTFHCANLLALQFYFFSNSSPENIGRLTKEEAIEMRINTTNAISKALAAANKLVAPQSYVLEGATKHCPAPSVAQFIIVCSFRKVDKHVFRAYNTISVTAQRTIIRKGSSYIEKRAILLPSHALSRTPIEQGLNEILIFFNATNKRDSVTGDYIYKIEDARNMIANIKHDASEHKSSYKDILEKEGLNKSEASRRIIFNRFKMQAIASYPALATLKAAQFKTYSSRKVKRFTLNSIKDLFTNLSKDYFLVRETRAITKSSLKFQNLSNLCSKSIAAEDAAKAANTLLLPKEVCAKILIESYKPIVQALAEIYVSIVYFNLDSKLELKVLEALC
ncbi:hypothetical protein HBI21_242480 [Parastagonospora nodorum]|nr:hypothetical protein HBI21_242480 [Parastagonospora nodorum]